MAEYKSIVNEELRDGPVKNRRCTDILCCLIFTCFFIAMIAVGVYGFSNGDPGLVLYPYDSSGNQCGRPDTVTDNYNYIYYAAARNIHTISDFSDYRVCVKSCPDELSYGVECYDNNKVSCPKDENYLIITENNSTSESQPYNSTGLWKRFCTPSTVYGFFDKVMDDIYVNGLED